MESEADTIPAPVVPFRTTFRCAAIMYWGVFVPPCYLFFMATYSWFRLRRQTGSRADYALLLLQWPNLAFVYPLVVAGCVSAARIAWAPSTRRGDLWVRIGVYTGMANWLVLAVLWAVGVDQQTSGSGSFIILLAIAPIVFFLGTLPWVACTRVSSNGPPWESMLYGLFFVVAIATFFVTIPAYFYGSTIWAAPLALVCYAWAGWDCLAGDPLSKRRVSLKAMLGVFVWLSIHLAAWRYAVTSMLARHGQEFTE
ncbi:hypothetical protein KOR34_41090 [Posidoniimonas corsicana]|uniref:Uncharacterized protein n=1 Tax=Posidoniimonas corsicana TaxID=1938618 RepID=A0A5C5V1A6_9BACT|nr:hypothetical protein [Posidoniimonas corsicana]TWT32346.1 hypothetical protein KOR34_41090 [Posidoniimonas corsicana]